MTHARWSTSQRMRFCHSRNVSSKRPTPKPPPPVPSPLAPVRRGSPLRGGRPRARTRILGGCRCRYVPPGQSRWLGPLSPPCQWPTRHAGVDSQAQAADMVFGSAAGRASGPPARPRGEASAAGPARRRANLHPCCFSPPRPPPPHPPQRLVPQRSRGARGAGGAGGIQPMSRKWGTQQLTASVTNRSHPSHILFPPLFVCARYAGKTGTVSTC